MKPPKDEKAIKTIQRLLSKLGGGTKWVTWDTVKSSRELAEYLVENGVTITRKGVR